MENRKYGWLPDLPDRRDVAYKVKKAVALKSVDLTIVKKFPGILDQDVIGSCTGNGWASQILFLLLNNHVQKVKNPDLLSRLFIYYEERVLMNTVNYDSGAYIRDGIKVIAKKGVCYEKTWAYNISKFKNKPTPKAYEEALKFKAVKYQRIDSTNLNDIVACLLSGFPIVHGFTVYESFETDKVARTGVVPMPGKNERALGGHCTVIVGYDLRTNRFKCANSWGTSWGNKGFYTIPASYLTNLNMADDFWTCQLIM